MPRAFGSHERVAAEGDGDVMMPAAKRPPFEVVETELALHVLIHPFGPPALLEQIDDVLAGQICGQCREVKSRFLFVVAPLGHQPDRLAITRVDPVGLCGIAALSQ